MASDKRRRQRANRDAAAAARDPLGVATTADLEALFAAVTVRVDCEHASTRATPDGPLLIRCARDLAVGGSCPITCPGFESRPVDGLHHLT